MNATAEINTPTRPGATFSLPIAASTKIWAGTLVAINTSGHAVPASDTANLKVIGRAEETVDNSAGAAAALNINVKRGTFYFANSATEPVTQAEVFAPAFIEDDNTVASASTNSVKAGLIVEIDENGVWIDTRLAPAI